MKTAKNQAKLLVVLLSCFFLCAEKDLIVSMEVHKSTLRCGIHPDLKNKYLTDDFFIEYEQDIDLEPLPYEILSLPLLLNLYSLVWFSGEEYYVDSMDVHVYESLNRLKKLIQAMYPKAEWTGSIVPRKLVNLKPQFDYIHNESSKKALLFSAGLDSTSSYFEHKDEDLHLITACGHPDLSLKNRKGFRNMKKYSTHLARTYGNSTSYIKSNYYDIFNWKVVNQMYPDIADWRLYTIEGMSWVGLALPILIAKKCSSLYFAAGGSWHYKVITADLPVVNECINCAGFTLATDQFDKTRFEKTKLIVDTVKKESLEKPFIKACSESATNLCGQCWKCCALTMSLLALGEEIKDYGFTCTDEQTVAWVLSLLGKKVGHFGAWSLKEIQYHARKSIKEYPAKRDVLEPFLDYDMSAMQIDWKGIQKFNWEDLAPFAPGVTVPQDLSQALTALLP